MTQTIIQALNKVSNDIFLAEARLRECVWFDVKVGPLEWAVDQHGNRRIMSNGKPLIENKVDARIAGHRYLSPLVTEAIDQATEKTDSIFNVSIRG